MSTPNASALVLVDFLLSAQETPPEIVVDENYVFILSHYLRRRFEQALTTENPIKIILETAITQAKKLPADIQETVVSRIRNAVTSIAMQRGITLN